MTLRDLIELIQSALRFAWEWFSGFAGEFIDVFFLQVSWMESSIFVLIWVIVAYGFCITWLLELDFVRWLFDKNFRAEERKRKAIEKRRLEKLGRRLAKKDADRRIAEAEMRAQNADLWCSSGRPDADRKDRVE